MSPILDCVPLCLSEIPAYFSIVFRQNLRYFKYCSLGSLLKIELFGHLIKKYTSEKYTWQNFKLRRESKEQYLGIVTKFCPLYVLIKGVKIKSLSS